MANFELKQFCSTPDPELICGICMNVLDDPKETSCRHVFCKECITTALETKHRCPMCRRRCRPRGLRPVLPLVQNLLNKLTMRCNNYRPENDSISCKEILQKEHYSSHLGKCDFEFVLCWNEGCRVQTVRKEYQLHRQSCEHRPILCDKGCETTYKWCDRLKHNCMEEMKKRLAALAKERKHLLAELAHLRAKYGDYSTHSNEGDPYPHSGSFPASHGNNNSSNNSNNNSGGPITSSSSSSTTVARRNHNRHILQRETDRGNQVVGSSTGTESAAARAENGVAGSESHGFGGGGGGGDGGGRGGGRGSQPVANIYEVYGPPMVEVDEEDVYANYGPRTGDGPLREEEVEGSWRAAPGVVVALEGEWNEGLEEEESEEEYDDDEEVEEEVEHDDDLHEEEEEEGEEEYEEQGEREEEAQGSEMQEYHYDPADWPPLPASNCHGGTNNPNNQDEHYPEEAWEDLGPDPDEDNNIEGEWDEYGSWRGCGPGYAEENDQEGEGEEFDSWGDYRPYLDGENNHEVVDGGEAQTPGTGENGDYDEDDEYDEDYIYDGYHEDENDDDYDDDDDDDGEDDDNDDEMSETYSEDEGSNDGTPSGTPLDDGAHTLQPPEQVSGIATGTPETAASNNSSSALSRDSDKGTRRRRHEEFDPSGPGHKRPRVGVNEPSASSALTTSGLGGTGPSTTYSRKTGVAVRSEGLKACSSLPALPLPPPTPVEDNPSAHISDGDVRRSARLRGIDAAPPVIRNVKIPPTAAELLDFYTGSDDDSTDSSFDPDDW